MNEFEFTGNWNQLSTFWNAAVISAYDAMIKCSALDENVSRKDGPSKLILKPKDLDGIVTTITNVTDINKAPEGFKKYMGYLDNLHIQEQLIFGEESHTHYSLRKLSLPGKKISGQMINLISSVCSMSLGGWINTLSIDYPAVKNPNCKVVLMLSAYRFNSYSQFQSRKEFESLGQGYFDLLQNIKKNI